MYVGGGTIFLHWFNDLVEPTYNWIALLAIVGCTIGLPTIWSGEFDKKHPKLSSGMGLASIVCIGLGMLVGVLETVIFIIGYVVFAITGAPEFMFS